MLFIGVDWSRCKHDLVIMDDEGQVLHRATVKHSLDGLNQMAESIRKYQHDPERVHVVVETHDGPLPAWMLEQGYVVYGINPKSAERARDCYRPAGTKDDQLDAYVLADWGLTHHHALRPLHATGVNTQELRGWVRIRARLVQDKTRACQRLRTLLAEWAPSLSTLCNDFNRKWQQDLLQKCPPPEDLAAWHGNSIRAWARRRGLPRTTAERVIAARSESVMPVPAARREVLCYDIRYLAETIKRLSVKIGEIDGKLQEHDDTPVFESLPVKGKVTVAALLAAFGEDREAVASWQELACRWGVAPVTIQSGRSRHVKRRRACDHVVNQTLLYFTFQTAFREDCWAHEYYQRKRKEGKSHYTTLRCLAQRWVKILYRIWKDRIPYCEQTHQKNRQQAQAAQAA